MISWILYYLFLYGDEIQEDVEDAPLNFKKTMKIVIFVESIIFIGFFLSINQSDISKFLVIAAIIYLITVIAIFIASRDNSKAKNRSNSLKKEHKNYGIISSSVNHKMIDNH